MLYVSIIVTSLQISGQLPLAPNTTTTTEPPPEETCVPDEIVVDEEAILNQLNSGELLTEAPQTENGINCEDGPQLVKLIDSLFCYVLVIAN